MTKHKWRRRPMKDYGQLMINPWILNSDYHQREMVWLYNRLIETKSLNSLFWDMENPESLSLYKFLDLYKQNSKSYIVWIDYIKVNLYDTYTDFMGFVTLQAQTHHKGFIGIWVEPKWRGPNTTSMAKQILTYLHAILSINHIYAITPWNSARTLARRSNMMSISILPNFCLTNSHKIRDAEIFYSDWQSCQIQLANDLIEAGWGPYSASRMAATTFAQRGLECQQTQLVDSLVI